MVFPMAHYLITVGGDAWESNETWQFSVRADFNLAVANPPTDAQLQAIANTLAAPTETMFTNASLLIANDARLLWIKVAHILPTGLYPATSAPGIYTYPTPVVGPGTGQTYPQVTMAVTLHTNLPRGRASKGRFYLPVFSGSVATDGRLSTSGVDAMEGVVRTWLLAINAVSEVGQLVVLSKLDAGTAGNVTGLSIGRVVDTMRSRRRALDEARTVLAL